MGQAFTGYSPRFFPTTVIRQVVWINGPPIHCSKNGTIYDRRAIGEPFLLTVGEPPTFITEVSQEVKRDLCLWISLVLIFFVLT